MVKAFVGIKVETGETIGDWTNLTSIRDKIAEIEGVTEVYGVFGRYDLMAIIDIKTLEEVNILITEKIRELKNVLSTETFIVSF